MNNSYKKMVAGAVLVAGVMLSVISASAAVLIEWQGDNNGDTVNFDNWHSEDYGTDTTPGYFTVTDGGTSMNIDPDTPDNTYRADVQYTTDDALTGNLEDRGAVGDAPSLVFNFYANANGDGTGIPQNLGFYFASTSGGEWYYDIDTSYISDGWNTFGIQLNQSAQGYGGSWYEEAGGSTFSITDVTRVGLWIAYNGNNSTQEHRIGLYGLSVPEPETYLILGMALLSVAIVFRKRISESLAEARAMMQV